MMVPTGIVAIGIALPGLISTRWPDTTLSPARNRCGARIYDSSPSWYFTSAMKAVRFGSYSSRSTVAGTSNLRRLKSTKRYACLCPPPMKRLVMRPWLLRPPVPILPSVSTLTGLPFHSSERLIRTVPRRLAVTGLNCLSAILCEARGEIDRLGGGQLDERLLHVRALARPALEPLGLALLHQRVDRQHGDAEQALDRCLDLALVRIRRDAEHELAMLRQHRRLLGDQRGADDLVHRLARQLGLALRRAAHAAPPLAFGPSRCFSPSTPAAVIASTSWFRMS